MNFRRGHAYGMTQLELSVPEFDLELRLLSRLEKRERRAVLLGFFRQIQPWLKNIRNGAIAHTSEGVIRSSKAQRQGIPLVQGAPLDSLSGAIGFEVRMRRLKCGMSQAQLAHAIGIARSHLSDIERGLHLPRADTRVALERVLKMNLC